VYAGEEIFSAMHFVNKRTLIIFCGMIFLAKTTLEIMFDIFFVNKKYFSGKVIERFAWVFQKTDRVIKTLIE